jgi:cytosine/adenosine deaminase-related metal-dependent hydrolase
VQRRVDDGDAAGWAERAGMMSDSDVFRVGAGIHSVRAVPANQLRDIVDATTDGDGTKRPLHVHVSEFASENAAALSGYGLTPARLLAEHGVLGKSTTVIHATHVTEDDVALIGGSGTTTCVCPTTAGDLGTGIAPVRALVDAGSPLALGSDQHAVVDLLAEARMLEMAERLRTQTRGVFEMSALVSALTRDGYLALGWDGGQLRTGSKADFFSIRLDTVRTAGCLPDQALMAASAPDVDTVVVGGRRLVRAGQHVQLGDVGMLMRKAIERAWRS